MRRSGRVMDVVREHTFHPLFLLQWRLGMIKRTDGSCSLPLLITGSVHIHSDGGGFFFFLWVIVFLKQVKLTSEVSTSSLTPLRFPCSEEASRVKINPLVSMCAKKVTSLRVDMISGRSGVSYLHMRILSLELASPSEKDVSFTSLYVFWELDLFSFDYESQAIFLEILSFPLIYQLFNLEFFTHLFGIKKMSCCSRFLSDFIDPYMKRCPNVHVTVNLNIRISALLKPYFLFFHIQVSKIFLEVWED